MKIIYECYVPRFQQRIWDYWELQDFVYHWEVMTINTLH
jgi:hypothetical protein